MISGDGARGFDGPYQSLRNDHLSPAPVFERVRLEPLSDDNQADVDGWPGIYLPALATLAAAQEQEPLTLDLLLGALAGTDVLHREWRPFLDIRGDAPTYRLYHPSLRDFLEGREEAQRLIAQEQDFGAEFAAATRAAHRRIGGRYLGAWGGLDAGLQRLAEPDARDLDGGYGLRHIAAHLEHGGQTKMLDRLLGLERAGTDGARNLWFTVREQLADTAGVHGRCGPRLEASRHGVEDRHPPWRAGGQHRPGAALRVDHHVCEQPCDQFSGRAAACPGAHRTVAAGASRRLCTADPGPGGAIRSADATDRCPPRCSDAAYPRPCRGPGGRPHHSGRWPLVPVIPDSLRRFRSRGGLDRAGSIGSCAPLNLTTWRQPSAAGGTRPTSTVAGSLRGGRVNCALTTRPPTAHPRTRRRGIRELGSGGVEP